MAIQMEKNCIFCKIVSGQIPALKLHEDEQTIAFLDVAPINKGHILVIPKEHHPSPSSIPLATAGQLFHLAARIGAALKRSLDAEGFNFHLSDGACAGQVVFHAHIHVVPRFPADGFHWNWRQLRYKDDAEMTSYFERVKSRLVLDS